MFQNLGEPGATAKLTAVLRAKKKLREANKNEYTAAFEVPGDVKWVPGRVVQLDSSCGKFMGNYTILNVAHRRIPAVTNVGSACGRRSRGIEQCVKIALPGLSKSHNNIIISILGNIENNLRNCRLHVRAVSGAWLILRNLRAPGNYRFLFWSAYLTMNPSDHRVQRLFTTRFMRTILHN